MNLNHFAYDMPKIHKINDTIMLASSLQINLQGFFKEKTKLFF